MQAERVFSEAHQLEPHRLEGLEIYSTTLWHLQKEVRLSALAQELTEMDRDAPQVGGLGYLTHLIIFIYSTVIVKRLCRHTYNSQNCT